MFDCTSCICCVDKDGKSFCDEAQKFCSEMTRDSCPENSIEVKWQEYIEYLHEWALDHEDVVFSGMSPVCFDEFCDE